MWAIKSALVASAVVAGLIGVPATTHATAGRDVTGDELWMRTADGLDYTFREITIAPGGSTGWHRHDGRIYGIVKEGTLTHSMADCSIDGIYQTGDGVFEPPGIEHIGRNLGPGPLVLQVLYILPAGTPLSTDMPDPGCGYT
jgi:quercetin dioxygenase-like cupin family protein